MRVCFTVLHSVCKVLLGQLSDSTDNVSLLVFLIVLSIASRYYNWSRLVEAVHVCMWGWGGDGVCMHVSAIVCYFMAVFSGCIIFSYKS